MREAVIVEAVRTPLGRGKQTGALYPVHAVDLAARALGALLAHQQRGRRAVGDLAGAARRDDAVLEERGLEAAQRLQRRVGAHALVAPDGHGAVVGGGLDGHELAVVAPLGLGPGGPLVRLHAERIRLGPVDAPLLRDQLGRHALRDEAHLARGVAVAVLVAGARRRAELLPLGARAHRHGRHVLDARGDHDVVCPRDDALRGEVQRLLRRPALAVDRGRGYRLGPPGGEDGRAAHVVALGAHLHDAADDDVVDQRRVEVLAGHEGFEHLGQ